MRLDLYRFDLYAMSLAGLAALAPLAPLGPLAPLAGAAPGLALPPAQDAPAPALRYQALRLDALAWTDGQRPAFTGSVWADPRQHAALTPYAVVEGASAVYLGVPPLAGWSLDRAALGASWLGAELTGSGPWKGRAFLPDASATRLVAYSFTLDASLGAPRPTADFEQARRRHHAWRLERGLPGAAWWRHGAGRAGDAETGRQDARSDGFGRSFALLTGGRALSENLRLDDLVAVEGVELATVKVTDIEGVTTPELDWAGLPGAAPEELDPLARWIPGDHHAVFLPSFDALLRVVDELRANGTPVLDALEPRAEDARTQSWYEGQLALELDAVARIFGGRLVRAVAVTGGDPYLRTGSDVALLFDCSDASAFETFLLARIGARAAALGVTTVDEIEVPGGLHVRGAATPDRALSSWTARRGDVVVVANSRPLLGRLCATEAGAEPALHDLAEYAWFRHRYPRGADEEAAFVVVPDGAIRRWCGPEWRIASARRVRAGALLAEAQAGVTAQRLGLEPEGALRLAAALPDFGGLTLDDAGPRSERYGTARFLTPIAELDVDLVTPAERDGYLAWRRGYDRLWGAAFDPIGARVSIAEDELRLDLSVRPIAVRSDYRDLIEVAGAARLAPDAGDPHATAVAHAVLAVDHESRMVRQIEGFLSMVAPELERPLSWVGDHVAIWLDADPELLDAVRDVEDPEEFMEEHGWELPVGVLIDVRDPLRMSAFLGALKALLQSAAPGVMTWETRELELPDGSKRAYVAIEPVDGAGWDETPSLYYGIVPGRLVGSLRESVVMAALERHAAGKTSTTPAPWLGESVAGRVTDGIKELLRLGLVERPLRDAQRRRAWAALPVLNEWRRLQPGEDPVEVQARLFGATVRCPGGGAFVWNAEVGSMESTVFGSPAAPRQVAGLPVVLEGLEGLDLGVTFEPLGESLTGLRARAVLVR